MTFTNRSLTVFCVVLLLSLGTLFTIDAQAGNYQGSKPCYCGYNDYDHGDMGTKEQSNMSEDEFNDLQDRYLNTTAISAAMANLPSISHNNTGHEHRNIGVAIGGYDDTLGVAVGVKLMHNETSFNAAIGLSGSETVFGAGAGINF